MSVVLLSHGEIGSGALPVESLPSWALRIRPAADSDQELRDLAGRCRALPVPVIGRLHQGALWFDLRCLDDEQSLLRQWEVLAP